MSQKLSIVIVTYNSEAIIKDCLADIHNCKNFEVIIVDNNSQDNTVAIVRDNFPDVRIIKNAHNIGYGRACNIGIKAAHSNNFTMIMNPDVLTNERAITTLLQEAQNIKEDCCIAPVITTEKPNQEVIISEKNEKKNWISGAVILFSNKIFKKIGYFDENIFLFYEENDLLERIKNAGFAIYLCHKVMMQHLCGKSSGNSKSINYLKYWHMGWSRGYFNKKHKKENILQTLLTITKNIFKLVLYNLAFNKKKRLKYKALLSGQFAFIKGVKAFNENDLPQYKNK